MHPVIRLGMLLSHLDSVEGRKKLQKLVHILQVAGAPFTERFELSHFGAYSSELKAELDVMQAEDLVEERQTQIGVFTCYVLKPGRAMHRLFAELEIKTDAPWLSLAERLNKETAQCLEGMSTVLYLQQRSWRGDALQSRFVALKPHLASNFGEYSHKAEDIAAYLRS